MSNTALINSAVERLILYKEKSIWKCSNIKLNVKNIKKRYRNWVKQKYNSIIYECSSV